MDALELKSVLHSWWPKFHRNLGGEVGLFLEEEPRRQQPVLPVTECPPAHPKTASKLRKLEQNS